MMMNAVIN